jgi:hypothetical protein
MTIELDNDMTLSGWPCDAWMCPVAAAGSNMRTCGICSLVKQPAAMADLVEAVAVARHRTIETADRRAAAFSNRIDEFTALFRLVRRADARLFAVRYVEMCDRLARREDA